MFGDSSECLKPRAEMGGKVAGPITWRSIVIVTQIYLGVSSLRALFLSLRNWRRDWLALIYQDLYLMNSYFLFFTLIMKSSF